MKNNHNIQPNNQFSNEETQPIPVQAKTKPFWRRPLSRRARGEAVAGIALTGLAMGVLGVNAAVEQVNESAPAAASSAPSPEHINELGFSSNLNAKEVTDLSNMTAEGFRKSHPQEAEELATIGNDILSQIAQNNGDVENNPYLQIIGDEAITRDTTTPFMQGVARGVINLANQDGRYGGLEMDFQGAAYTDPSQVDPSTVLTIREAEPQG